MSDLLLVPSLLPPLEQRLREKVDRLTDERDELERLLALEKASNKRARSALADLHRSRNMWRRRATDPKLAGRWRKSKLDKPSGKV